MKHVPGLFCIVTAVAVAPMLHAQAPTGWTYHLDRSQAEPVRELAPGAWAYQEMPPGWHLTTTNQGVTLFPDTPHPMSGAWGVEMEFFLFPEPSGEGVGIALLPTTESEHSGELRLLLRRDGQVSATVIAGSDTVTLAPWTSDTSVVPHDGKEIKQYVMRVMHQGDQLTLSVDGRERLRLPIGPNVQNPVAGIRAGAGLNLHIARFDLIRPLAPPRPATP